MKEERHATTESQVTKCISKIQYFSQSVCRREKRTERDLKNTYNKKARRQNHGQRRRQRKINRMRIDLTPLRPLSFALKRVLRTNTHTSTKRFWRKNKKSKVSKAIPCASPTSSAALHFSASLPLSFCWEISAPRLLPPSSLLLPPPPPCSFVPRSPLPLSSSARVLEFARARCERSFYPSPPPPTFPFPHRTHTHSRTNSASLLFISFAPGPDQLIEHMREGTAIPV